MQHKMNIAGLTMDPTTNTPIIILKSEENDHAIPIWIGLLEATSIASVLQEIEFDRPMTHDLFKSVAQKFEADVTRVEICDLKDNTFYARIYFTVGEEVFDLDARPSDAIAIALRFAAPIFVDDKVVQRSKTSEEIQEVFDQSEEGKKWADYLQKLSPEDFGKYKV